MSRSGGMGSEVPIVKVLDGHTAECLGKTKQLVSEYINTWYATDAPWSEVDRQFVESLPGRCIPPEGACLLAFTDDEALGSVLLLPKGDDVLEVLKLYVRPDHRRGGIARILMEEALRRALRLGRALELQVHSDRLPAIALYRSLGFIEQNQRVTDYLEMQFPRPA